MPPGFEEWKESTKALVAKYPHIAAPGRAFETLSGEKYVLPKEQDVTDDRVQEWEGETNTEGRGEGPRTAEERRAQARDFGEGRKVSEFEGPDVEVVNEPALTADQ